MSTPIIFRMLNVPTSGRKQVASWIAVNALIGPVVEPDELGEIPDVDVDIVVHFENKINLLAVPVLPVEEAGHFKR